MRMQSWGTRKPGDRNILRHSGRNHGACTKCGGIKGKGIWGEKQGKIKRPGLITNKTNQINETNEGGGDDELKQSDSVQATRQQRRRAALA